MNLPKTLWECPRCKVEYWLTGSAPVGPAECYACLAALDRAANVVLDRFAAAGVPPRFRGMIDRAGWSARFGPWPAGLAAWAGTPSQVLLIGPEGNGKTGLATLLLLEHLARSGGSPFWLSARDLVAALEDSIAEGGTAAQRYRELFRRARFAPFLVLDDLFAAGRTTPLAVESLAGVLTTRYDHELPTVVTTNAKPSQLKQALRSLGSRLLDGLVVSLEGPDTRGRG